MPPVLLLRRNASAPFGAAFPSVGAPSLTVRRLKERSAAFMRQGKEGEKQSGRVMIKDNGGAKGRGRQGDGAIMQ